MNDAKDRELVDLTAFIRLVRKATVLLRAASCRGETCHG